MQRKHLSQGLAPNKYCHDGCWVTSILLLSKQATQINFSLQLRPGDLHASYSSAVLQKQLKLAVIVSLDRPEAQVTLLREEANALAPVPVLFIMPESLLGLTLLRNTGSQGLRWSQIIASTDPNRYGLNGNNNQK